MYVTSPDVVTSHIINEMQSWAKIDEAMDCLNLDLYYWTMKYQLQWFHKVQLLINPIIVHLITTVVP